MRLEEQGPSRDDESAAPAADVNAHEQIEAVKDLAALSPAERDRAYRVIFAGAVDPRHPARWNPIP